MTGARPGRLVVVTGTGTEVGKTWWCAAVARALRARGLDVAVRKPVQSFSADDASTDADVLGAATGETPDAVCPTRRWIAVPLAPPMAAAALGLPPFTVADLARELAWPGDRHLDVGLVEGAGGLRSPLADDGDTLTLVAALAPDDVVVVADAALGVVHSVRMVRDALGDRRVTVALNHFDPDDRAHRASRDWLVERDGVDLVTSPEELAGRWA
ncbi:MAG: hypothetical protein AMXMBFR46_28810 [Acidimicrobiia bacterium]